jgi:uncharacterized membrane protein
MPLLRLALASGALVALAVAINFGAVYDQPAIALVAVGLIMLPALLGGLRRRRWGTTVLLALGSGTIWAAFGHLSLLYAIPVAINLVLLTLFASTLLPGRKPLITAYVALQYASVPPAVHRYTRGVTIAWAGFFLCMVIESLSLALFAPVWLWSSFVNFFNYLFVAAFFAIEYLVRRRVLRGQHNPGFKRYVRGLVHTDFRRVLKETT